MSGPVGSEGEVLSQMHAGISSHERKRRRSAGPNTHLPAAHELAEAKKKKKTL